jgi:hypothetical protein
MGNGAMVFQVPGMKRTQIRGWAMGVRSAFECQQPWFPIVEVVEYRLADFDQDYVFEVGDAAELGDRHGITIPSEHRIIIREDVYDGACRDVGRDRFTMAHELGHYILHHTVGLERRRAVSRDSIKPWLSSEWQADAFAGELLMPVAAINGCRTFSEIVAACGVSNDAAHTQVAALRRGGMALQTADG